MLMGDTSLMRQLETVDGVELEEWLQYSFSPPPVFPVEFVPPLQKNILEEGGWSLYFVHHHDSSTLVGS